MNDSKYKALEEFCDFFPGGRRRLTKKDYVERGFPAFSAAGQDGYVATWEFDRPGVVVSSIGARCGKSFLAEGRWTTLANTHVVIPNPSVAEARFLWYQMNDEHSWHRSGTGQPFIKPSDIKRRRVYVPALSEQRRIVDLLSRAENIVRMRREAEVKARETIPALFLDMFGDPVANNRDWPVL
ncbi:MAG: restriction endonuclease subunit S, partial [Acidobacteria bacterium]|nr:restriction endonuclease subunit S [Acidobacteriota bacterium]